MKKRWLSGESGDLILYSLFHLNQRLFPLRLFPAGRDHGQVGQDVHCGLPAECGTKPPARPLDLLLERETYPDPDAHGCCREHNKTEKREAYWTGFHDFPP